MDQGLEHFEELYSKDEFGKILTPNETYCIGEIGKIPRALKIIDVGCGAGFFIKNLKMARKGKNDIYYGVDGALEGVNLAKNEGIVAKQADLNEEIPFPDNSFDIAICSQTIEHIYNTDALIKEINRVLKKGGHIFIATPNLSSWYNRVLLMMGVHPLFSEVSTQNKLLGKKFLKKYIPYDKAVGHIRSFTPGALSDLVQLHGFITKRIKTFAFVDLPTGMRQLDGLFSKLNVGSDILVIARKK